MRPMSARALKQSSRGATAESPLPLLHRWPTGIARRSSKADGHVLQEVDTKPSRSQPRHCGGFRTHFALSLSGMPPPMFGFKPYFVYGCALYFALTGGGGLERVLVNSRGTGVRFSLRSGQGELPTGMSAMGHLQTSHPMRCRVYSRPQP